MFAKTISQKMVDALAIATHRFAAPGSVSEKCNKARDVSRTQLRCKLGYKRLVLCICVLSMTRHAATPTASAEQKGTNANKKRCDFVLKVAEQAYVWPVCVLSTFCLSQKLGWHFFCKYDIKIGVTP
jgi:hypothetical protein